MEASTKIAAAVPNPQLHHTLIPLRRTAANRLFATIYSLAIFALLYHHSLTIRPHSIISLSFLASLTLLLSDVVLAFMWSTTQSFRMCPVLRRELVGKTESANFPAIDVFICTADPYKEPPLDVVNTALSVMAYDYPAEKLSVYISDDGGSELTLFAFMEAVEFARYWLPFCRENDVVQRCPEVYFKSTEACAINPGTEEIKLMYENMKMKVEDVIQRGKISPEFIAGKKMQQALDKWATHAFTRQDHPTIIQILVDRSKDKDIGSERLPNLVYISREKRRASPHHFKAGALNMLDRVSAIMTNAPIILTLDCDMYSNDPQTPLRALCYHFDSKMQPELGYIQFPQRFHGINQHDIYANEHKWLFHLNARGMNGLLGPNHFGTGCFFTRRALFGGPSSFLMPEIPQLSPYYMVNKPIDSQVILDLAYQVTSCDYEYNTLWGFKVGFRYGSLVEDYFTGYQLQCEGWKSVFCNPDRPAFLGGAPISLNDVLSQNKRWAFGLLEVGFSKYSPITFGAKSMGPLMGLSYSHYAFWPTWSIPITIYAFLPQLALLNKVSLFPKVSDPWFLLYAFLFLGSYSQDLTEFLLAGGTFRRWWSDQRIWLLRGLSSYLFGFVEFLLKSLRISALGFNITSKVDDSNMRKRYDRGIFEFGEPSPMFVPLTMAAIVNLIAFLYGLAGVLRGRFIVEDLVVQLFMAGFGVVNCWPIYEAMAFRKDKGRMHAKTIAISVVLVFFLLCGLLLVLSQTDH